MNKVADLCILNIICLVCCIPIVTAGASITAMYYVTLKMVRNEEAYIVRSFFKSFKDNFKQATIINLIMIAVGAVLYLDLNVAKNMPGSAGQIFHCDLYAFVIIYYVLFYMFIRFLPGFTIRSVIRSKMHCSCNPPSSVYSCHGTDRTLPAAVVIYRLLSDTVHVVCSVVWSWDSE